ncbi:hypothetical protein EVAR_83046_1 [Eumeta japonica]|uniref:Uncharacterized protein n=1 Tax=Eumeta variegata TaxID=151549 RepID=A0A4C1VP18_EUMVA|nr:hypothetical protein EVAR_83046_1 [Eumeta japonica]
MVTGSSANEKVSSCKPGRLAMSSNLSEKKTYTPFNQVTDFRCYYHIGENGREIGESLVVSIQQASVGGSRSESPSIGNQEKYSKYGKNDTSLI